MTASLPLESLELHGFRSFDHLRVEHLSRVNLIVGKNGVGKTALLEALWLYGSRGSTSVVWQVLEGRDEGIRPPSRRMLGLSEQKQNYHLAVRHLFHGRRDVREELGSIQIGPVGSPGDTLSITPRWFGYFGSQLIPLSLDKARLADGPILALAARLGEQPEVVSRIAIESLPSSETSGFACVLVHSGGLTTAETQELWDKIALTSQEPEVVGALSIIDDRIERVNLLNDPNREKGSERIPKVKLANLDEPVFLRSLGDGAYRLFGLALSLVNSNDGMLLVDEVENGLHYSVQRNVWKLIFETARRLNVQVFGTTHSWDCVQAFQQVAEEVPEEGTLIRLAERKGEIVVDLFDQQQMTIASEEQIELR